VKQAVAMCGDRLDRFYEAELYRLEGDILREMGELSSAEEALMRAVALAERQGAALFLTRAQAGLAHVRLLGGKNIAGDDVFTA
jgi:hypothetical protein